MERDRSVSPLEWVREILLQERPEDGDEIYCIIIAGIRDLVEKGDRSFAQYLDDNPEIDLVLTKEREDDFGFGTTLLVIVRSEIEKQKGWQGHSVRDPR